MRKKKRIALVAHDDCKQDLLKWARLHTDELAGHKLFATGSTGKMIAGN